MRRLAFPVLLAAVVVALALWSAERLDRDRRYRTLLADGEAALQRGETYQAIEAFSGAQALRPEAMPAYLRRGAAYRQQKQDDQAIRDLREAARRAPDAPEPLVALAEIADARGDMAQAADWYGQAADRKKDEDAGLLYALALARYRAGNPAAARDPLRRAIARQPTMAEAHYLIGLVYRDSQDMEGATASLEQAVRLKPTLVAAREELADLYAVANRPVDEMRHLQALTALDNRTSRRIAIALAEARHQQFDGALGTLNEAVTGLPEDSRVQLAIGRVNLARAEQTKDRLSIDRARTILEKALAGTTRRSEGLALYGRAMYLSGDAGAAERLLREAVTTSPVALEAFAYLADAAERLGHRIIARDALLNLDVLEGDTAPLDVRTRRARRIGTLSLDASDPWTAAEYFVHAVDTGGADAATLGQLARARWQIGDAEGARTALQQAIAQDRRNAALKKLTRTIK